MKTEQHLIIVGAGLAGSILAYRLIKQGCHVTLFDGSADSNCSRTAAGIINPITGIRLVKSRDFDLLYQEAMEFYQHLSDVIGQPLFYPLSMLRLFKDEREVTAYQKRCDSKEYHHLLGETMTPDTAPYHSPLGGVHFKCSGYVDTNALLDYLHDFIKEHGVFEQHDLDYQQIELKQDRLHYQGKRFDRVIFSEGYRILQNPWFSHLPLQGAKGEIVSLSIPDLSLDRMLNRGQWLIPRADGSYRYGATHYWAPLNEEVNQQGVDELMTHYPSFFADKAPQYVLTDVKVGVRPATKDRQPFLGATTQFPQIMIFNGFGAKGSLMIPWYSQVMANHILHHHPIPESADIRRFGS